MTPRPFLAVATATVLVFIVGGACQWWMWKVSPPEAVVQAQLRQNDAGGEPLPPGACSSSTECDAGMGCVFDAEMRVFLCHADECRNDLECGPGRVCRRLQALDSMDVKWRCVLVGNHQEGEPCFETPDAPEFGCAPDLFCLDMHCRRRCRPADPSTCPSGYSCRETESPNGPLCAPDCRQQGCPSGKQCLRFRGDFWACGVLVEEDCDRTGCPRPEVCEGDWMDDVVEKLCLRRCDFQNQCPEGTFCAIPGFCKKRCDPDIPESCPPRHICVKYGATQDALYGCDWSGNLAKEELRKGSPP